MESQNTRQRNDKLSLTEVQLKCVLLHICKQNGSTSIADSTILKEVYQAVKTVRETQVNVRETQVNIMQLLNFLLSEDDGPSPFLLGQQNDFIKYPCFLKCLLDSKAREKHWKNKQ